MKTTAKTNVNHIEQARAEVTFNGKKAIMTLDWEKPTRFYIHVRGMGTNKVIAEEYDPRAILMAWTRAMKKHGGELVARTPKQRDLQQKQHQLAADFRDSQSAYYAPEFLRELRKAYLVEVREGKPYVSKWRKKIKGKPVKKAKLKVNIHSFGDKGDPLEVYDSGEKAHNGKPIFVLLNTKNDQAMPVGPEDLPHHLASMRQGSVRQAAKPVDPGWKKAAEALLKKSKGKTQDDFYYRAYLKAVISGTPSTYLTKKYKGAKKAMEDLIDEYGKGPVKGTAREAMGEPMKIGTEKELQQALANAKWPKPRRMFTPRTMDQEWVDRGTLVATKSTIYARKGSKKVVSESIMVNKDYLGKGPEGASGDKDAYQAYFEKKMKSWGIKSPEDLDDAKKKKFFNEVDEGWKADKEGASGGKGAYKAYFDKKMKEWGISSPAELDDAKKKKFFDEVDKGWKGESEGKMVPMHEVGGAGGEGGWKEVKLPGKPYPYRWRTNDLYKKNPRTQAALDIQYKNPKVGWRDVTNLSIRDAVQKAAKKQGLKT
ncbi:MAG: hypothetical protein GWN58_33320 [Anaerolineae bacterium]|nr:hypothetical protein [Anaerolineae bacterium]